MRAAANPVENPGASVKIQGPSCGTSQSDTFSPPGIHMSDEPATLRERVVVHGFHRAYYH
jgi:hypothetical protein